MSDTARDYQQFEPAAVEGLDQLFGPSLDSVQPESLRVLDIVQDTIPVTEAANLLGVDRRSVVRLLSWKKLDGVKDERGRWLVSRCSVLTRLKNLQDEVIQVQDSVQPETTHVQDTVQLETIHVQDTVHPKTIQVQDTVQLETIQVQDTVHMKTIQVQDTVHMKTIQVQDPVLALEPHDLNAVVVDVDELLRKLEGASFRIGYLEAQLEAERNQVKLLTDSLHKPSLWTKFKSWFLGAP
jgi:excisionase family DNA binding protein